MYNLFSKKIIALFVFLTICLSANAQTGYTNRNYSQFKQKPYYYGLSVGLSNNYYRINNSTLFNQGELYKSITSSSNISFNINLIGNLKMGDNVDLRLLPGLSFSERTLEYLPVGFGEEIEPLKEKRESVYVEVPFQIRYKSQPYKDKRAFLVAGAKYGYDVSANRESKESVVKYNPHDIQLEVGFGVQFFYPYFIFSPEIKYSRGFSDNVDFDNNVTQTTALESVTSELITLSFHFEG